MDLSFYKNKKVFITGHTGFKGTWMCKALTNEGADVVGYSLLPPTQPSLFELAGLKGADGEKISVDQGTLTSYYKDIRDLQSLVEVMELEQPEFVIHMAAQPIVRDSYKDPVYTYETNVMGTVNILEAVRRCPSVKSVVNVTTDKVYLNREWQWGYRENEELNGYDPYSNSKSCSELVTSSYKNAFFGGDSGLMEDGRKVAISTCRAGNVIGGGDFANDRIIPDCIRAVSEGREIIVRNPYSTRPYQHVLEPVMTYLMIASKQHPDTGDIELASSYNVGPNDDDCWTTGDLVTLFCDKWNAQHYGSEASWKNVHDGGPHEANFLKLDCSKIKNTFGWKPAWNVETAMEKIVDWTIAYMKQEDVADKMICQIKEYSIL